MTGAGSKPGMTEIVGAPPLSDMRFQYSVILQYIKCDTGETNLGVECKLLMAVKP